MSIRDFDSEEEMDEEFERIQDINFEWRNLQDSVEMAREDLEQAEKDLREFEEENKEWLIS